MICNRCYNDLAECTCPDCAARIRAVMASESIAFAPDYAKRLEAHAKEAEEQQTKAE